VTSRPSLPPDPKPSILPKPEVKPVVRETEPASLSLQVFQRMPECGDTSGPEETRILLVVESGELEQKHGILLREMLKAIGYQSESPVRAYRENESLAGLGARVLVMGNTALQAVSTSGMDLAIVRGMWQQSTHGKLISTFPPSYLHDNPPGKKAAWGDLQKLLNDLGLEVPDWTRKRLKGS